MSEVNVDKAFDESIYSSTEPELNLPEATQTDIKNKISAESTKIDKLQAAEDVKLTQNDAGTITVITKDSGIKKQQMSESQFDAYLRRKRSRLEQDRNRLRTLGDQVKVDIAAIKTIAAENKQGVTSGSLSIQRSARSASAYLRNLSTRRRTKKAGQRAGKANEGLAKT